MKRSLQSVVASVVVAVAAPGQDVVFTVGKVQTKTVPARADGKARALRDVLKEAVGRRSFGPCVLIDVHETDVRLWRYDRGRFVRPGAVARVRAGEVLFVGDATDLEVVGAALAAALPEATRRALWRYVDTAVVKAATADERMSWRLFAIENHPKTSVRVRHLHDVGGMGAVAAPVVPVLVEILDKGERDVAEAIVALGRIGPHAFAARRRLQTLVKHEKHGALARAALEKIGDEPPEGWIGKGLTGLRLAQAKLNDQVSLRWQFQNLMNYKTKYRTVPRGGGRVFLADPWCRNVVQRTPQNLERFFSAAFRDKDPEYQRLRKLAMNKVWPNAKAVRPSAAAFYAVELRAKRGLMSGKRVVMCSPMYADGTVAVLYGDGVTKIVTIPAARRATWSPAEWKLAR